MEGQDALVRTEVNGKPECVFQEKKVVKFDESGYKKPRKLSAKEKCEYFQLEGGTAEGNLWWVWTGGQREGIT